MLIVLEIIRNHYYQNVYRKKICALEINAHILTLSNNYCAIKNRCSHTSRNQGLFPVAMCGF